MSAPSELDADTAVERIGESRFRVAITDRWSIGTAPNGGYLALIATRAIGEVVALPDPFTVTTHFLSVAKPALAEIEVRVLRAGRGHSTAEATLMQDGAAIARTTATFGDLARIDGPTHMAIAPPVLPPLEHCAWSRPAPSAASISDRLDVALDPSTLSWLAGEHNERPELAAWMRLRDRREPDALSLVFFADALPPPVLNLSGVRTPWVPTLELTVHIRARPAPGWLRAAFRTRALVRGYLDEEGELWDSTGALVATSRQLARVQRV